MKSGVQIIYWASVQSFQLSNIIPFSAIKVLCDIKCSEVTQDGDGWTKGNAEAEDFGS